MRSQCNVNFISKYAYIVDSPSEVPNPSHPHIDIETYLADAALQNNVYGKSKHLVCQNGHELIKYKSDKRKSHFKHKHCSDTGGNPMTTWHSEWQSNFLHTEVLHKKLPGGYTDRYADAMEANIVLEFQHSHKMTQDVDNKNHDFSLHKRQVYWIIDCQDSLDVEYLDLSKTFLLIFKSDHWKYENFKGCEYIFLDKDEYIFRIKPSMVKGHMIDVYERKTKQAFISDLKANTDVWNDTNLPHCTLYLNQRGAGCGKTYESIQLMSSNEFQHKTCFVYLTKMKTVTEVIHNEFKEQYKEGRLITIEMSESQEEFGRQYKAVYKNKKTGNDCQIIIGTIDSFMYALGNKSNTDKDFFKGLVRSIIDGYEPPTAGGVIRYAGKNMSLNKRCLLIVDEAQDLQEDYILALAKIMRSTYTDVYVIGDKLQSIWFERNIYTFLEGNDLPHTTVQRTIGKNIVRRFHNEQFKDFVNNVIDFNKYDLPSIESVCDGACKFQHANNETPYHMFEQPTIYSEDKDDIKINNVIKSIIQHMEREVHDHGYLPKHFMFIFPIIKMNKLAQMLETGIQLFWINKFENKEYQDNVLRKDSYWVDRVDDKVYHQHAFLHKSEDNKPINLKESEQSTRLLSIHASKGQGCEVVFLLSLSESALVLYSKQANNLMYDSLLHVAVTRQKLKLYIGLTNTGDDIYRRFSKTSTISVLHGVEPSLSNASKYNKIQDVSTYLLENRYKEFYETVIKPAELHKTIPKQESINRYSMDWGHHIVRYCVFLYTLFFNMVKNTECSVNCQLFAVLHKIKSKTLIFYYDQEEYYRSLRDSDQNDNYIPILYFSKSKHTQYYKFRRVLRDNIKSIQKKLRVCLDANTLPQLCPLEMAILVHLIDVHSNGQYHQIGIMDVYKIIYVYQQCFKDNDHTRFGCECNKCFEDCSTNENASMYQDMVNSITNHYEITKTIRHMYDEFLKKVYEIIPASERLTTNIFHKISLQGSSEFTIWNTYIPLISHSSSHVFYFIVKPTFNLLNFNEVIFEAISNTALISHCDKESENFKRYHGKTVIVCVFTFDSIEPIFIQVPITEKTIGNSIEGYLYDKYTSLNERVYQLYEHYHSLNETNAIECILDKLQSKSKMPSYITDFFVTVKTLCETASPELVISYASLGTLNELLKKRIKEYLGNEFDA
jgi:hypothetical protein